MFLGESTRYVVRTGNIRLTVKQQNRGDEVYKVGEEVTLTWRPEHASILPD